MRWAAVLCVLASCRGGGVVRYDAPANDAGPERDGDADGVSSVRFAVIGDFGVARTEEADVARLIESWRPDLVLTTGDNNYSVGAASTIDANIGQFFHRFIHPYRGEFGPGATENRFFPSLGNHDWMTARAEAYLDYFTLPGNERYYDFRRGPAHFFCIDSDSHEPDGVDVESDQARWLEESLSSSTAPFKLVFLHHPPLSSSSAHGSHRFIQWPFAAWGATAVFAGHDHTYEHVVQGGVHYFVTGLGGRSKYGFAEAINGSQMFFNGDYGAMLVDVTLDRATFRFEDRDGSLVDEVSIPRPDAPGIHQTLVPARSEWRYYAFRGEPSSRWADVGFDDGEWAADPAPLGRGDSDLTTVVGRSPGPGRSTIYLRHGFDVADPRHVIDLQLGLSCDDGAVAYLNGVEVARRNMPDGTIVGSTPATRTVSGSDEDAFFGFPVPTEILLRGRNVLAVELHQVDDMDGDAAFDAVLDATVGEALVPRGSEWRFLADGSEPGARWREGRYVDSTWSTGRTRIGWGNGDEATVLPEPPEGARPVTTYFRKTFDAPDPAEFYETIVLRLRRDDGAVVYLNGAEVTRTNMPSGDALPSTLAASEVRDGIDDVWTETLLDTASFAHGANVLGVEVHLASESSEDMGFDLEIIVR